MILSGWNYGGWTTEELGVTIKNWVYNVEGWLYNEEWNFNWME